MKAIEYLVKLMRSQEGEWKVEELMTKNVITIEPEVTVHDAVEKMRKHGIHSIIVAKDDDVLGIVSYYDILLLMASREHGKNVTVGEIMNTDLITVGSEEDVMDSLELMLENHVLRLPVLDNGKLVGIITTTDFVNVFDKGLDGEG
ncbi:MAG: CBS domain-containing protein, partial [Candidatus Altiarchaeota archaeon]|nr:CBS domain-containing protein [Candidatus Altiarchaeota archaeon]